MDVSGCRARSGCSGVVDAGARRSGQCMGKVSQAMAEHRSLHVYAVEKTPRAYGGAARRAGWAGGRFARHNTVASRCGSGHDRQATPAGVRPERHKLCVHIAAATRQHNALVGRGRCTATCAHRADVSAGNAGRGRRGDAAGIPSAFKACRSGCSRRFAQPGEGQPPHVGRDGQPRTLGGFRRQSEFFAQWRERDN